MGRAARCGVCDRPAAPAGKRAPDGHASTGSPEPALVGLPLPPMDAIPCESRCGPSRHGCPPGRLAAAVRCASPGPSRRSRRSRRPHRASPPGLALGRLLGLDRAPEVNSLRRKLARLAALGCATQFGPSSTRRRVAVLMGGPLARGGPGRRPAAPMWQELVGKGVRRGLEREDARYFPRSPNQSGSSNSSMRRKCRWLPVTSSRLWTSAVAAICRSRSGSGVPADSSCARSSP